MLATLIITFLPLLYILYVIYDYFSSPLLKVPNAHPTAPFSRLWILSKTLTHQRNRSIQEAHLKHGPIVRLGPLEVSVNDPALVKAIYSAGSGFDKPAWYQIFTNYGFGSNPFLYPPPPPRGMAHEYVDHHPYFLFSKVNRTRGERKCYRISIQIRSFRIPQLSLQ